MLLAIDAGNTNIVFAVHDGDEDRAPSGAPRPQISRTADEYAVWLSQLLALEGLTLRRSRRLHHLHRGAAGAVQPAQPLPQRI